jgi:hypothetical protein
MNWDAIQNLWNQAVLNFTAERQRSLISHLGVAPSWRNLSIVFAATVTLLLVILAVLSLRNRELRDPLGQLVAQLRARLAVTGLKMRPSEGLSDLRSRVGPRLRPAHAAEACALLQALEDARYGRAAPRFGATELRRLRGRIKRFRPQLESQ